MPLHAGETLQLEGFALPLATRGPSAIQRAQVGVDGTGVGLGAESGAYFRLLLLLCLLLLLLLRLRLLWLCCFHGTVITAPPLVSRIYHTIIGSKRQNVQFLLLLRAWFGAWLGHRVGRIEASLAPRLGTR